MRRLCVLFVLFASTVFSADLPLQQWIDEAIKAGGGVVTVPPGVHVLPAGLKIKDAKKLAIRGMDKEQTVLKLPPLACAQCAAATPAGALTLPVRGPRHWAPGMVLHIEAEGAIEPFTQKPKPYVTAVIASIQPDGFALKEALAFPVPAGAAIRHANAPNLIDIRGSAEGVELANLTLDGGMTQGDPPVQGHAQLCAVFAAGPYGYAEGPKGPPLKNIVVRDCIIQNCFGRGVAFYSVVDSTVERCSIRDCNDEAIDLDHFTSTCTVRGNRIIRCRIGVEMNDASRCVIEGNEIRDSGIGLNLWRWCKQAGLNEGNVVRNNLVAGSSGNGFQIATGTAKNVFEGNEIRNAGRNGISLSGEDQTVRGNTITGAKLKAIAVNQGRHRIDEGGEQ